MKTVNSKQNPDASEYRIGNVIAKEIIKTKKELPTLRTDGKLEQLIKPLGSRKIAKILRNPDKLSQEVVMRARENAFWILQAITKEKIDQAPLTVLAQALPVMLNVAKDGVNFAKDTSAPINVKNLQMNIINAIKKINKCDPAMSKEMREAFNGLEIKTEKGL